MLDRRIELLRVLDRAETITEAAELLQRSVSGYSRQLRSLADELGVELLEHQGRKVRLTPAAQRLVDFADDAHAAWERAAADLSAAGEDIAGTLRIGSHTTGVSALVAPHLGEMADACPRLRITVSEADVPSCFDRLLVGDLDACIVAAQDGVPPVSDRRFHQQRLISEPIDALVRPAHPLAGRASIGLGELAGCGWVLPEPGEPGHAETLAACHAAGFSPSAVHHAHTTQAVADLVAATASVALTPRFARFRSDAVRVPLTGDPAPTRTLLLCTRAGSETRRAVRKLASLIATPQRGAAPAC